MPKDLDSGAWILSAVRLAEARTLLHDASRPVSLWRQRGRYALLVGTTRAIGHRACLVDPHRCHLIHATPGHCVMMYAEHRAAAIEADITASRAWLAERGIQTTLHRANDPVGLDARSWPQFQAAWRLVQRDPAPKATLRTRFPQFAPVALDDWDTASTATRHPLAQQISRERRRVVACWDQAALPAFLGHMPVDDLLAHEVVPDGLALVRLDACDFRTQLLSETSSGRELLARGAQLGQWFLVEVPRLVARISRALPAAHRIGVLLSVSDDIVLAGSAPVAAAARRVLAGAWAAYGVGVLAAGVSVQESASTLADLSRAALLDLTTRTAGGRARG